MATLIAFGNGLFTGAATWDVVDAIALLDSEAASTAMTIAYVESAAFTPGAITIDGIAVKVAARAASPTGTISIRLALAAATVAGTELTINVSDIESRAAEQGWYLFKFAAPVLLVVATAYTVSAKCSVNAEVTLYRNSTAGNWSRLLRTTTPAVAGAGDNLHILGEWTAPATKTNRTVTMDSTAATDYCDGTAANPPQFTIGKGGTMTFQVTAATTYILRLSGKLWVYVGGTLNIGTVASAMPRDSSGRIEFDCGADGDFGLVVYGTYVGQGQSRTSGLNIVQCKLNTDEAVAQTALGVDTDTGWLAGDEIALASTTRTLTQCETRVLSINATATVVTVTAGLTNAHSGTSPTQAEMILLTRNVRVESVSTSFMAYVLFGGAAAVDCDWVAFRYMGANTIGKRGVEINTTTAGSCTLDFCSFREFDRFGCYVTGTTAANFYIRNCVGYLVGSKSGTDAGIAVNTVVTSSAWEVSDCTVLAATATAGYGLYFEALGGIVARIVGLAQTAGIGVALAGGRINGTCNTWTGHSCGQNGISLSDVIGGRIDTLVVWRSNGAASQGGILLSTRIGELTLDGVTGFGNGNSNITLDSSATLVGRLLIRDGVFSGDTTFSAATGFTYPSVIGGSCSSQVILETCTFGVASGIKVQHTGADIEFTANTPRMIDLTLRKTLLASTTEFANRTQLTGRAAIRYQMQDQVAADHLTDYPALGLLEFETTVFHSASPSEKLTPSGATAGLRLRSQVRRIPVQSGEAMALSVWVRKSSLYTGSAVRLLLLSNSAIGISDDTVLDSMVAAADTWEQLTATCSAATADGVLEVVIECDGSAGIVYVDDWAAAVA